ncbi:biotin carboxylase [Hymenobacter sp. HMF4947]|uniref:Biotin carboxylase n=1 Tax=Hymenobacter ginkgonis TaxID=2682976 RepID=A0A7K1TCR8_9BACT|nr:ATP-grasp domain-containing protein [Hymenobacter ginkgonis]MVN76214.1 biotin carboxylase [Hymenobacter ginkgonis]
MSRRPLTVALTGLNATDSPGAGVAVARALRESPEYEVRLIGLSYEALEPGIYLRELFAKTYLLPYPAAGSQALLERLEYVQQQENIAVIIPNFDAELPHFIRLEPQLRAVGIRLFVPTLAQLESREKLNLSAFGTAHALPVPATHALRQATDLAVAAIALGWPLVLKGRYYEAQVVHTLAAAEAAFGQLAARWGLPLLAQQFVAGQELNVAGLADGRGQLLSAVPMRKLTITDKGKAWAGITLEDEGLTELARRFAAATQWRGGFELELLRTAAGEVFILEINPRFPAWVYLAVAAGHNQPAALLRLALGEGVGPFGAVAVGKLFVRYAWDMIADYTDFQRIAGIGEL